MGCPSVAILSKNLTFSICTHDPDTGVLTDADAAPSYRVYEDETAVPILTGTMAKLDDVNTTGFYTEQIACTAANGFETYKTYTIYIEATVDSDTGGISFGFTILGDIYSEILDARSEPSQGALPVSTALADKIDYLYKFLRNKIITDSTTIKVYDDAGTTVDHQSTISDDGSDFTRGEFESGA